MGRFKELVLEQEDFRIWFMGSPYYMEGSLLQEEDGMYANMIAEYMWTGWKAAKGFE